MAGGVSGVVGDDIGGDFVVEGCSGGVSARSCTSLIPGGCWLVAGEARVLVWEVHLDRL